MAARPRHGDRIAPMGTHGLPQGGFGVEVVATLITIGDRQPGAMAHAAGVRLQVSEYQAQERRFANAIRSDQANTVTAHDAGREVTYHHLLTERFRNLVEFHDHLT